MDEEIIRKITERIEQMKQAQNIPEVREEATQWAHAAFNDPEVQELINHLMDCPSLNLAIRIAAKAIGIEVSGRSVMMARTVIGLTMLHNANHAIVPDDEAPAPTLEEWPVLEDVTNSEEYKRLESYGQPQRQQDDDFDPTFGEGV